MTDITLDAMVRPQVGGFERVDYNADDVGIKVLVWGGPKEGKTHFALSAPQPVYLIDLDFGSVPLLATTFKDQEIYRVGYRVNETLDPSSSRDMLIQLHSDYAAALADLRERGQGTIVIDTLTHLTQLIQTVKLAEVMDKRMEAAKKKGGVANPDDIKIFPFDYAAANQYTSSFLRRAMEIPGINAVFTAQGKAEYNEKGQPTGKIEYAGYKEAPYALDATIRLGTTGGGAHIGRIEYCRFDRALNGVDVEDPSFATFKEMFVGAA